MSWITGTRTAPAYRCGGKSCDRYMSERRRVIEELRQHRYDVAIDVRIWFPNFVPVLGMRGFLSAWASTASASGRRSRTPDTSLTAAGMSWKTSSASSDSFASQLRGPTQRVPRCLPARPRRFRRLMSSWDRGISRSSSCTWVVHHDARLAPSEVGRACAVSGRRWPSTRVHGSRQSRAAGYRLGHPGIDRHVNACDRLSWAASVELVRRASWSTRRRPRLAMSPQRSIHLSSRSTAEPANPPVGSLMGRFVR